MSTAAPRRSLAPITNTRYIRNNGICVCCFPLANMGWLLTIAGSRSARNAHPSPRRAKVSRRPPPIAAALPPSPARSASLSVLRLVGSRWAAHHSAAAWGAPLLDGALQACLCVLCWPHTRRSSSLGGATAANDPRPINDKGAGVDRWLLCVVWHEWATYAPHDYFYFISRSLCQATALTASATSSR